MFFGRSGDRWSNLPARLILANGIVVDLVGRVDLEIGYAPELLGDSVVMDTGPGRLDVRLSATDFQLYLPGEQAPEQNSKLRALPSGADRLPLERVDGEILPED